jgi:hypothetical protein
MAKEDKLSRVPPYLPILWEDWDSDPDTSSMTDTQTGVFFKMLKKQWVIGRLPRDAWKLSREIKSSYETTLRFLRAYPNLFVCSECGRSWSEVTCECGQSYTRARCENLKLKFLRIDVNSGLPLGTTEPKPQPKPEEKPKENHSEQAAEIAAPPLPDPAEAEQATSCWEDCTCPNCDGNCACAVAHLLVEEFLCMMDYAYPNGMAGDAMPAPGATEATWEAYHKAFPQFDPKLESEWRAQLKAFLVEQRYSREQWDRLQALMVWAYGRPEDDWWKKRTANMKAFITHVRNGNLVAQFEAAMKTPEFWPRVYTMIPERDGVSAVPFPFTMADLLGNPDEAMITKVKAWIAAGGR